MVGAVAAKTVGASRRRFWVMTALGGLPDLDFLAGTFGSSAEILQHRSVTHSLIGVFLLSFLLAWGLRRWDQGAFRIRFFHYLLPLAVHLACDLMTSFGCPLFMPFSYRAFSWDFISSVNILPMVVMSTALMWSSYRGLTGWRATRWAWATWALYLGLMFSGKLYAERIAESYGSEVTALPSHCNPFSWRAVEVDGARHAYRYYDVNLLKGRSVPKGQLAMPNGDFPVRASLQSALVQHFLKNNRWPMVRITKENDHWEVEWGTLMFSSLGAVRGKVLVSVDFDGQIRQETRVIDYWTPEKGG